MGEKKHICYPDFDWQEPGSLYPTDVCFNKEVSTHGSAFDRNPLNPQVFFDIMIGNKSAGKIVMELFHDVCPNSAINFQALCTGESGVGKVYKKPLHFKGTRLFRIVPDYMAQGGDVVNNNGTGGECIWGERFADENFVRKHIGCGIMSWANKGANTNASQFFYSLGECPWLDGQYVVFGQVLEGFDILRTIQKEAGSISGQTTQKVVIVDCGVSTPT